MPKKARTSMTRTREPGGLSVENLRALEVGQAREETWRRSEAAAYVSGTGGTTNMAALMYACWNPLARSMSCAKRRSMRFVVGAVAVSSLQCGGVTEAFPELLRVGHMASGITGSGASAGETGVRCEALHLQE